MKIMKSLFFSISVFLLAILTNSQPDFDSYICGIVENLVTGDEIYNYTVNSTAYKANLHTLLTTITSNSLINYGFYNLSVGQNLDKVYGVGLCRGDISSSECRTCINYAASKIGQVCPSQNAAIGWYQNCMIRYSKFDIFKGRTSKPRYNMTSPSDPPDPKSFNRTVSKLMSTLAHKAAVGDSQAASRLKFATGEVNVTGKHTVYALLQCVPDMEEFDCLFCLKTLINYTLADCCYGKDGVRVGAPSCNLRFENYRFYKSGVVLPPILSSPPPFSSQSPPSSSVTSRKGKSRRKRNRVAISIITPIIICLLALVLVVFFYLKRRRRPLQKVENEVGEDDYKMIESLQLEYGIVKAATNNFADANKLGQGGFGTVYKGTLPTGQVIAVKRLSTTHSGQGEKQFKNEALLVAKLQHRNLVRFLGFCLVKEERLVIYEYLPNKSLDHALFDPMNSKCLDWEKRYKIIEGIARGLLYLHEESRLLVVHRDLKAANVLLDEEMNPKISDFGVARLFGADQSQAYTSKIAGTCGYMPPEYVIHGNFSIKSDVFSFGVLVLEIISGQKVSKFSQAQNGESLISYAWKNWSEGNALRLVDSTISAADTNEVLRCINIALLCVQENATQRPIMSSIVLMLNSYSITVPVPSRPAFFVQKDADSNPPPEIN